MDCPSARVHSEVFGHCIANVKCDAFASNGGQTTRPLPASAFSTCTMLKSSVCTIT
jgi:hypothetical protein